MHRTAFHHFTLLLLALLLHACATQPPALRDSEWQAHQQQLQALVQWQFRGKVAFRTLETAESASLHWTQQERQSQLQFSGPMGFNQLTLLLTEEHLTLFRDGQWQTLSGEEQLEQIVGWDLPVEFLAWWVRGLPAPKQPVSDMQLQDGRLSQLQQAGWTLSYDSYRQVGNWVLPAKIRFEQDGVSGKILLKEWEPGL